MSRSQKSRVQKKFVLKVRRSGIPGAGQGLFTETRVEKGDAIIEYSGERLTWPQVRARYPDLSLMGYVFYVGRNHWVDPSRRLSCLARYANDARGRTRVKGLRNNAEFQVFRGVPYVVATRRIEAGGEILVSYGKDYWENHLASLDKAEAKRKRAQKKKSSDRKRRSEGSVKKRGKKAKAPRKSIKGGVSKRLLKK